MLGRVAGKVARFRSRTRCGRFRSASRGSRRRTSSDRGSRRGSQPLPPRRRRGALRSPCGRSTARRRGGPSRSGEEFAGCGPGLARTRRALDEEHACARASRPTGQASRRRGGAAMSASPADMPSARGARAASRSHAASRSPRRIGPPLADSLRELAKSGLLRRLLDRHPGRDRAREGLLVRLLAALDPDEPVDVVDLPDVDAALGRRDRPPAPGRSCAPGPRSGVDTATTASPRRAGFPRRAAARRSPRASSRRSSSGVFVRRSK